MPHADISAADRDVSRKASFNAALTGVREARAEADYLDNAIEISPSSDIEDHLTRRIAAALLQAQVDSFTPVAQALLAALPIDLRGTPGFDDPYAGTYVPSENGFTDYISLRRGLEQIPGATSLPFVLRHERGHAHDYRNAARNGLLPSQKKLSFFRVLAALPSDAHLQRARRSYGPGVNRAEVFAEGVASATVLEDFDPTTLWFLAGIIPTGDPVIRGEI